MLIPNSRHGVEALGIRAVFRSTHSAVVRSEAIVPFMDPKQSRFLLMYDNASGFVTGAALGEPERDQYSDDYGHGSRSSRPGGGTIGADYAATAGAYHLLRAGPFCWNSRSTRQHIADRQRRFYRFGIALQPRRNRSLSFRFSDVAGYCSSAFNGGPQQDLQDALLRGGAKASGARSSGNSSEIIAPDVDSCLTASSGGPARSGRSASRPA